MDRRHFVKNLVLSSGGLALPTVRSSILRGRTPDNPPYPAKLKIQYIREDIPPFEIPVYRGQSYQDTVPDTLDIAERAKLGVHALTSITDPAADYEVYWAASFFRNPPVMSHDFNDWVQICEGFQEALPLLRTATGDDLNSQVDRTWMEAFLKCIGPDGLLYVPLKGRPWSRLNSTELDPLWKPDGTSVRFSDDPSLGQVTSGEVCARALGTLTVYYLRDRNPLWKEAGERMVNRLSSLAVQKGDYCYLVGGFEPNAKVGQRAEMPVGLIAEEWDGRLIQGLSQYYKAEIDRHGSIRA